MFFKIKKVLPWIVMSALPFGFTSVSASIIVSPEIESRSAFSNKMFSDYGTNHFDEAIIDTGNEVIRVKVDSWYDYDDSDAIVIKTSDGILYYTHLSRCVLIEGK